MDVTALSLSKVHSWTHFYFMIVYLFLPKHKLLMSDNYFLTCIHTKTEVITEESVYPDGGYDDTSPAGLSRRHQQDALCHCCSNTVSAH